MTNKEKYLIKLVRNKEGDTEAVHYAKWRRRNKEKTRKIQMIILKLLILSDKFPFMKFIPVFLNKIYTKITNYLQIRSWKKSL